MEKIDLTTPEPFPTPISTTTSWRVDELRLSWSMQHISILLVGSNNEQKQIVYNGEVATALMVALNKANLSVKSLHKRVLEYLVADGKLAGTITGTVD